jgi:hypothetical protein
VFVSCSQLGVVPAVLTFFFYETDTLARVVYLGVVSITLIISNMKQELSKRSNQSLGDYFKPYKDLYSHSTLFFV